MFADSESQSLWWVGLPVLAFAYALAFIVGFVATASGVSAFGPVLARILGDTLNTRLGLLVSAASAALLSVAFGLFASSSDPFGWSAIALFYALPAAAFYRREVLTEREIA